ncbi:MAG: carbon-nitrogen hydrolase family protein [Actinomycetota bacterium]|nr:carbon-nitrogen hydrolase family protein [Actinomycetota bacterium]
MRILLAAMTSQKGDVAGNLAQHVALLEQAATGGCDLAVFPEMSLTGSVDPTRRPDRLLAEDSAPVLALARATGRTGVAALFGLAERGDVDGGAHISQVFARMGEVVGTYRKRHFGDDEDGFTAGGEHVVFEVGAARFGVAICAEADIDGPWAAARAAGADLVCFCAAPGLHGRRTDVDGWRAGHRWWVDHGLGAVRRHARRRRLWVAMATQAGATADEDFPGGAALVDPDGAVTARLPDWRPGTLVVDVPVPEVPEVPEVPRRSR